MNDEIFSAQIEGSKVSAPTLVVKGEDVPEVHWAFWSNSQAEPALIDRPSAELPFPYQPFSLTLSAPKQPLKAGQVLLLRVNVTNTLDSALTVPDSEGVFAVRAIYQVHVSDQDGRPVPPRPPAKGPGGTGRVVPMGSVQSRTLNPGESFTDLVNVTDECDLSQPGTYQISVAEPYGSGPDRSLVESNPVTVNVVK